MSFEVFRFWWKIWQKCNFCTFLYIPSCSINHILLVCSKNLELSGKDSRMNFQFSWLLTANLSCCLWWTMWQAQVVDDRLYCVWGYSLPVAGRPPQQQARATKIDFCDAKPCRSFGGRVVNLYAYLHSRVFLLDFTCEDLFSHLWVGGFLYFAVGFPI